MDKKRRLIQLYSALLHNAHLKGFIDGEIYQGKAKYACAPGLNCYSCPGAAGACPLGSLQNALASAGHRVGWYLMGILLLFGIILGRTICGWLCPFGLIQELFYKIPTFKIRKNKLTRGLSWVKYLLLAVFVIAIPLWYGLQQDIPMPGFCKYICPAGTLEGALGLLSNPGNSELFGLLGIYFTSKIIIMLIILLACIFSYRSFCRFLCPLGAIYGLFNRFCLVGVRVDPEVCNGCGACQRSCGMDILQVGDHECIQCAKCMDVCRQKAISFKAGGAILISPETASAREEEGRSDEPNKGSKKGRRVWGVALVLLCFALVWFNFLDPAVRAEEGSGQSVPGSQSSPGIQIGSEPGMQLEEFTITCLDGSEFKLADTRGKVTVINLWATYCTPCVKELPYFETLGKDHEGDIAILAVHSSMVTDDTKAFLADRGYTISFAIDTKDDKVWKAVNGSSTLPQTIVLDRKGAVIYNQKGSVTPEVLEMLYQQASRK